VAKSFQPRRRKRRSVEFRNSLRLALVLSVLTGVNVYVFFFRDSTSIRRLVQPSVTGKVLVEEQKRLASAPVPAPTPGVAAPAGAAGGPSKAARASSPSAAVARPTTPIEPRVDVRPDWRVVEGKVGNKDTLGDVLGREGYGDEIGNVIKALSRLADPKTIRPGDAYVASFDAEGRPAAFEYVPSPALRYVVTQEADGAWRARKEEKPLETKVVEAAGSIESSLYEAIHKAGESGALVSLLVDIFAWDINFYIDTHPGDHFKVVIEKHYLGGKFYKYGQLLAAEYGGRIGTYRAFAWSPAPGRVPARYFDERGHAIAKTLLKSPLRYVRISSKFDRKRFHPILHRTKAHLGVDYAAPVGTPVWASASGKVAEVGMRPGSGNTVVISHGGGLTTRYYHLSRFAKGLRAGQPIKQKEVLGYVGTTGLSTGPHLHFSVTKFGAFVDPASIPVTRESPVSDKAAFLASIRPHLASLKSLPPVVAAQR
jgi:murein DD-endopeptidase MepM/ murein hydrolase activator NlpD